MNKLDKLSDLIESMETQMEITFNCDNVPYFLEPDYIDDLNIKGWILNNNKSFSRQKIASINPKEVLQLALLENGQSILSQWEKLDMKIY
ncbi:hypothetical protein FC40_GL000487 [Ligilactobacillus hayakitensis DSM 18933 = JCM 14209]|uniref:Uncharacterized protein n=1 Tax=Ligilactobacillus hayakitensis DSM 18933 = JCM 14209 TaxID=1423755 RepID=A0A0R1WU07_9LACO|nr:hypothetical protein [Ligilactobacillus hayakitensis]KRM19193.1 hypothetical protein FC40_GL000487 [Ligilactobacillus hayakitensis DSM 18933 = JCM 14209]